MIEMTRRNALSKETEKDAVILSLDRKSEPGCSLFTLALDCLDRVKDKAIRYAANTASKCGISVHPDRKGAGLALLGQPGVVYHRKDQNFCLLWEKGRL